MALDFIIIDGDQVMFNTAFGPAMVQVIPGKMKASGKSTVNKKNICVAGDEKNVVVSGCSYTSGGFTIPGTGNLKIASLGADQLTQKSGSGKKQIILKGSVFNAIFEVLSPAQQPVPGSSPIPDPLKKYPGTGQLITSNSKIKAS